MNETPNERPPITQTDKPSGESRLEEVSKHWQTKRLKGVCVFEYGDSLAEDLRTNTGVPVYGSNGLIGHTLAPNAEGECLIIGRKGSSGKVLYSEESAFAIDTTFFVDHRHTGANIRWLYYLLTSLNLESLSGDVGVPGLSRAKVYQQTCPDPPPNEQNSIVRYLDNTDQRIRTYVSAKERLIGLLEEVRQALIHQAVTRGLDPNVRLKPSGVEWLSDVPEHWEEQEVKKIVKIKRGKFTHRPRNDPSLYDGPYPFVQTGDIARATKTITGFKQTLNERGLAVSTIFPAGTLVMTIAANIGDVAILNFDACFPDSVVGFIPNNVQRDYLYYMLKAMKDEFLREAPVNTQGNLNVDRIGSMKVALPPVPEQTTIVEYLDKITDSTDHAIHRADQQIELMNEYRTRLIADVVTGKLDVREAAERLPDPNSEDPLPKHQSISNPTINVTP